MVFESRIVPVTPSQKVMGHPRSGFGQKHVKNLLDFRYTILAAKKVKAMEPRKEGMAKEISETIIEDVVKKKVLDEEEFRIGRTKVCE